MALIRSVILLLCLCVLPVQALAADFPERPLTMVIGYAAGGSTDIQGRVLAEVLGELLGQPVRVSNIPGAGGAVAAAMLASSTEQGHVFQYGISSTISISPLLAPASYDLDSFIYVAGLSLDQSAYVTSGQSGFQDWPSLLQYLRDNPGQVYVTQTAEDRLLTRAIAKREGLDLRIVPTSGGAGMAPLVLSGEVFFAYSGGTHTAYTDSGQMRVLASLAEERLVGYPQAPTLRELGYDLALHAVRVVTVPADTPVEQVEVLTKALVAAARDPRFIEVTETRIRQPIRFMTGAEVRTMLDTQVQDYRRLIEEIGLQ
ncbi:tripartite tricarboxylate transporter substrate binding protein [Pseudomonas xionganensis]|uniref:Tripartite tricarboxylate transporter substrate binding protein n=1 Tax=Pseudomonas xionganensis TaxID=2654845 RepID=A0A6I4L4J5_9PSED|nr:tripartite tricarboxylate transporter substrate binding protein [Pseudomonas xionganensis]MVW76883.1 tripartite tricarboxylate transporter substrate binding protein [Pseudomonas xionganensis]